MRLGRLKLFGLLCALALVAGCGGKTKRPDYSEHVWPPPPDEPRIELVDIIHGRVDVEGDSILQRTLLGATPGAYDWLRRPHAAAYDEQGRLLVTDSGLSALLRFDQEDGVMDVLGTKGSVALKTPLGMCVGPQGTIYVADVGLGRVVALNPMGKLLTVYGGNDELTNPTDAAVSPDGSKLYVADSKAHAIRVFDRESAKLLFSFGKRGEGEGEFAWPTSIAFSDAGDLFVVDQINSRVQVLTPEGEYIDEFGQLGVGFASFVRPKDVAIDEVGLIYVTDAALNNLQLFDSDFTLLTFVGSGGQDKGQFKNIAGIAVQGDRFALVDQLNKRVQLFRFLVPKGR